MRRILTYDVKDGNDYKKLYDYIETIKGKKLTESTYELDTPLSQKDFESKIKSLFSKNDNVYYISVFDKNNLFYKKIVI
mgnify:FL=1